jgi:hypothetical protein
MGQLLVLERHQAMPPWEGKDLLSDHFSLTAVPCRAVTELARGYEAVSGNPLVLLHDCRDLVRGVRRPRS